MKLRSGRERVAILIGSSTCGASANSELGPIFSRIVERLREDGRSAGYSVATIGVALDWDTSKGLRFLNSVGAFDEIGIGRNWLNHAAISYIWRDLPGSGTIPQVIVVERNVTAGAHLITVSSDSVVVRKAGLDEIRRYDKQLEIKLSADLPRDR